MNFQKKFLRILILFFFIILLVNTSVFADEPIIYSPAAILMDAKSGQVLYEKNANSLMFPASTTKVMTAIIALENCSLDEKITASHDAITSIKSGYTNANIQVGEQLTMEELLYALLLNSANEAANVIAERIGGTIENFANMMNAKAIELGCTGTHFVNANGIHADNHFTTAFDLATITRYCMQNDTFRHMVSTLTYTLPATEQYPTADRILKNSNHLLTEGHPFYYPYAIGVKTGFTTQAKNCLIAASNKDGYELISIVLHAETTEDGRSARYLDTINLLEYGNQNFQPAVPENTENHVSSQENAELIITENTEEISGIDYRLFVYILLGLVFIRLLIAFLKKHVIIYRAEKLKKRARRYLNP